MSLHLLIVGTTICMDTYVIAHPATQKLKAGTTRAQIALLIVGSPARCTSHLAASKLAVHGCMAVCEMCMLTR